MLHITDDMIDAAVTAQAAQTVLRQAFESFGNGQAAMQRRERTDAAGVKLSTLGAVIPEQGVVGAKVYTTIKGQFNFVILLFSARDGRPLATMAAGALTRKRTAACTVLAATCLGPKNAQVLGLFGAGTQGREHAAQLSRAFSLKQILVNDPYAPPDLVDTLSQACQVPVALADAEHVVSQADLLITASRSTTPLFSGAQIKPGAFVGAIGSSLPHTRELDDAALQRARHVVVEWRAQSLTEAGDLVMAGPGVLPDEKIVELADVLLGRAGQRQHATDINIYKSVGVGLEDIALAGHAYQVIAQQQGLAPA